MFFKEYKPTCVELLFGKNPMRFMAECAIPRHPNAKLRNRPALVQREQAGNGAYQSDCRYCPDNPNMMGNIIRIDDFSSSPAPEGREYPRTSTRTYDEPKNQWKRDGEPKSNKEKFKEWYINKRVEEMRESERLGMDLDDLANCCMYCHENAREETGNGVFRCGCCVCGEAAHEVPGERQIEADEEEDSPRGNQNQLCRTCRERQQQYNPEKYSILRRNSNNELHRKSYGSTHQPSRSRYTNRSRQCYEQSRQYRPHPNVSKRQDPKLKRCESEKSISRPKSPDYVKCVQQMNKGVPRNEKDLMGTSEDSTHSSSDEEKNKYLEKLKEDSLKRIRELNRLQNDEQIQGINPSMKVIPCHCQYSIKNKNPDYRKCKYDEKEVGKLREKLDQALAEIKKCRHEVEHKKKEVNCSYDPKYSASILNDCQKRCAHLERLVEKLDHNLGNFEDKHKPLKGYEDADNKIKNDKPIYGPYSPKRLSPERNVTCRPEKEAATYKKKPQHVSRIPAKAVPAEKRQLPSAQRHSPRKPKSAEGIKPDRQVAGSTFKEREPSPKKVLRRSSSSPRPFRTKLQTGPTYRVSKRDDCSNKLGGPCYHIKCYPSDHVLNNPVFKPCREYNQIVENMKTKRPFKPR